MTQPSYVVRPLVRRDASGILTLEQALVRDGRGMVKTLAELPADVAEMERRLGPWLAEGADADGCYPVAAATRPGTVPILGSAEVRRLPLDRIRHGAVVAVGVHPDHQRQGIGRALLRAVIAWAAAAGVRRLELYVLADNDRARRLYAGMGFEVEGRRRGFVRADDGTFRDDLVMARWHEPDPGLT